MQIRTHGRMGYRSGGKQARQGSGVKSAIRVGGLKSALPVSCEVFVIAMGLNKRAATGEERG